MSENPFKAPESLVDGVPVGAGLGVEALKARQESGEFYLEYHVAPDDLVKQWVGQHMNNGGIRRLWIQGVYGVFATLALWVVVSQTAGILMGVLFATLVFGRKFFLRRAFLKQINLMKGSEHLGRQRLTFHSKQIIRKTDFTECFIEWQYFEKLWADEEGVYMQANPIQIIYIPRREFDSAEAAEHLAGQLRTLGGCGAK